MAGDVAQRNAARQGRARTGSGLFWIALVYPRRNIIGGSLDVSLAVCNIHKPIHF
jgi:hypothetical protein